MNNDNLCNILQVYIYLVESNTFEKVLETSRRELLLFCRWNINKYVIKARYLLRIE